jgi:hypothetical protein
MFHLVASDERFAPEKRLKDRRLEDLDQLQLSATLHLETLELGQGAVKVEHGVAFLELLALLLGRREDHREVRAVHLEKDGVLAADFVAVSRRLDELVVLRVRVVLLESKETSTFILRGTSAELILSLII